MCPQIFHLTLIYLFTCAWLHHALARGLCHARAQGIVHARAHGKATRERMALPRARAWTIYRAGILLANMPPGGEEERRHSNKHSRHPGDRASGSPVLRPGSHSQGAKSEHLARAVITLARPILLSSLYTCEADK